MSDLIGRKEVAKLFNVKYPTVQRLEQRGLIHPKYVGNYKDGRKKRKYDKNEVIKAAKKYKVIRNMNNKIKQQPYIIKNSDYKKVINLWNSNCKQQPELRSKKVNSKDNPTLIKQLRGLQRISNLDYIKEQIQSYFDCCQKKKHLRDGNNFAYLSLTSFLKRIYTDLKNKNHHWWNKVQDKVEIEDKHPNLTRKFAYRYAQEFTDYVSIELKNPSKEYSIFKIAGDYFKKLFDDTKKCPMFMSLSKQERFDFVFNAVFSCARNKGNWVEMKLFASKYFWDDVREHIRQLGIPTV